MNEVSRWLTGRILSEKHEAHQNSSTDENESLDKPKLGPHMRSWNAVSLNFAGGVFRVFDLFTALLGIWRPVLATVLGLAGAILGYYYDSSVYAGIFLAMSISLTIYSAIIGMKYQALSSLLGPILAVIGLYYAWTLPQVEKGLDYRHAAQVCAERLKNNPDDECVKKLATKQGQ